MLKRTKDVIRKKNRLQKSIRIRHRNELLNLRNTSIFKAKLYEGLKSLEIILQDPDIESVIISVPDKFIAQFSTAIYSEDLASYEVTQVENETNKFYIKRKYISF